MPNIINMRGEKEPFSYQKVFRSAKRVGASNSLAEKIAKDIEKNVTEGMKTKEIFRQVREQLYTEAPVSAIRFNLKEAMRRLGPTGFPFEKYIGRIFSKLDYKVKINQIIKGKCISYETDFLAEKGGIITLGECKYRNQAYDRVHTNDALVSYARYLDLKEGTYFKKEMKPLLVTNTKFTSRTIRYAKCVGLGLLGWRYPATDGLEKVIEANKLYPITILSGLSRNMKETLVSNNIMLVEDVLELRDSSFDKIKKEAKLLLEEV